MPNRFLGLLADGLQGASNAAASNISAPVDMLAWALRKAGVPVGDAPIGGSDWMAQKGLTRQPTNQIAGLLGESLGGVAPIVAAAKAPQIARGLLQAGENMAARPTLNPEAGAIVWHGSPHKFDRFDSSKIGTGEGAQAYGRGLYLAEAPEVAKQYAGDLAAARASRPIGNVDLATAYQNMPSDVPQSLLAARRDFRALNDMGELSLSDRRDFLEAVRNNIVGAQSGNLYKVDLPDEHIAKMLDWDSAVPESQRVPLSQAALKQFGSGLSGTSGEHLYKEVVFEFKNAGHPNPAQAAADWLRENGAPGIRYLDGGSRSVGTDTSNFVVFPGNEGLLSILERNGKPIK